MDQSKQIILNGGAGLYYVGQGDDPIIWAIPDRQLEQEPEPLPSMTVVEGAILKELAHEVFRRLDATVVKR